MTKRLSPDDAGCFVSGWWGQYGMAQMVVVAESLGYADAPTIDVARRHLATMESADEPELSDDESELLNDYNDAEQWLNDHVAPEGYSFGWHDAEFFLMSDDDWQDS